MQLQFKGVSDHTIIQFLCRQTKKKSYFVVWDLTKG